jgi:hypothetical protein
MRNRLPFIALTLMLAPLFSVRAGDVAAPDASASADTTAAPSNLKTSYEFNADTSYVGGARTNFGSDGDGNVSEQRTSTRFLVEPQYNGGPIYRLGLGYERYNFGFSKAAPIPDSLQAENLVLGVDFELFNSWLIRVEADPGLYGDGRSRGFRDFNVPFILGGSYIASEEVQWIVGLGIDIDRQIPVIPAVGVRWSLTAISTMARIGWIAGSATRSGVTRSAARWSSTMRFTLARGSVGRRPRRLHSRSREGTCLTGNLTSTGRIHISATTTWRRTGRCRSMRSFSGEWDL